jgi:hypothetical protein
VSAQVGITGTLAARAEDRDIRGALVLAGIGAAALALAVLLWPGRPAPGDFAAAATRLVAALLR